MFHIGLIPKVIPLRLFLDSSLAGLPRIMLHYLAFCFGVSWRQNKHRMGCPREQNSRIGLAFSTSPVISDIVTDLKTTFRGITLGTRPILRYFNE